MPPLTAKDSGDLVKRRHNEWREFQRDWRWLQDSLEGGNRYKHADYTISPDAEMMLGHRPWYSYGPNYGFGVDTLTAENVQFTYGQIVDRNLVPHLSETGEDGRDIYALRLHRTPVPTNVARAISSHLSRIYSREITRKGSAQLKTWWEDVDGCGTPMDRWMQETVAPLLLVLGQIDLVLDLPKDETKVEVKTVRDKADLEQDRCIAAIILPENLVWWEKDARGRYLEVLVLERKGEKVCYRHWTATDSNLYDARGVFIAAESHEHELGFCPVVRVFDRRKVRCKNVGQSQYESIADLQRAIYNARSELILGDVQQSHAQLQGNAKYLQKDAVVPVGPSNILPVDSEDKIEWSYVEPPKGAQQEVRVHIQDFQDEADRDGALLKPAGMTQGTTVAQSGVSKIADQTDGNAMLAQRADTLERAEILASQFALAVITNSTPDKIDAKSITITYPKQFELYTLEDLSAALDDIQRTASLAGALPEVETELLQRMASVALPGLDDDRLKVLRTEIEEFVANAAKEREMEPEPTPGEVDEFGNPIEPDPMAGEQAGGNEPDFTKD